jgi:hypothetical protein
VFICGFYCIETAEGGTPSKDSVKLRPPAGCSSLSANTEMHPAPAKKSV